MASVVAQDANGGTGSSGLISVIMLVANVCHFNGNKKLSEWFPAWRNADARKTLNIRVRIPAPEQKQSAKESMMNTYSNEQDTLFVNGAVVGDAGNDNEGIMGNEWMIDFGPRGMSFSGPLEYANFRLELMKLYARWVEGYDEYYCDLRNQITTEEP